MAATGRRWTTLLLMATSLALYFRIFGVFFGVDDFFYIAQAQAPSWPGLERAFAERYLAHTGAFYVNLHVFGLSAGWHHLIPLALHVLNAYLVFSLFGRIFRDDRVLATTAAVLFALHPAAYTVLAWVALGNEEIPALTLTLLAVHLFLNHLGKPGWRSLVLAAVASVVACGFKNQAVMVPAYLLAFAVLSTPREGGWTMRRVVLIGGSFLPFVLFDAWYLFRVIPQIPQAQNPLYATDFSIRSVGLAYLTLLANTLNVLPFGREAIGYQQSIPAGFVGVAGSAALYRSLVLLGCAGVCVYSAVVLRRLLFLLCMLLLVVLGLFFAAVIPHHLYEYYAYFSLPAVSGALALPVLALRRALPSWPPRRRAVALSSAATLVVAYAFGQGHLLHATNLFVRQAENARAIDGFVSRHVGKGQALAFVPPSGLAYQDSVYGASINVLHRDRDISVAYLRPGDAERPDASTSRSVLVAFDRVDDRDRQLYLLDQAQWTAARRITLTTADDEVVQPIRARGDGITEIQMLLQSSWPAEVVGIVEEVGESSSGKLVATTLATARIRCGGGASRYYALGFPVQAHSAGREYRLRLTLPERSKNPVGVFAGQAPATMLPLITKPLRDAASGSSAHGPQETLVFRLVRIDPRSP